MSKYEYVNKNEYGPVREELESIIKKTQKILKKNAGITFQFELIGSGSKHLITRLKNGNKGFDFDYNLILNCKRKGYRWDATYARNEVTKALDQAIKGTKYDHPNNSAVAITIKVKDTKHSKIIHSCDFAVVYYPDNETDEHMYSRLNLKTRNYSKDYHGKLEWLKINIPNYWSEIKDEYLKLKDANNDINKKSFQLFFETVNNVYNRY